MKESVTKFDLEAAFKALDEIDIPVPEKGIKSDRINLQETFANKRNKKLKTELLIEDYYDVNNQDDMAAAKTERDGEVAKAKLARIEKIVDLDAKTPEELQQSYVGKYIVQCPNCMTLFYKDEADVAKADGDDQPLTIGDTVNQGEECQHCKNKDGYMLMGKVGEVAPEEAANYEAAEEATEEANAEADLNTEEVPAEEGTEEEVPAEENTEEVPAEEGTALNALEEVPVEEEEEEVKEEAFRVPTGSSLNESALTEDDISSKIRAALDSWSFDESLVNKEAEQYVDHLTTENRSINEAVDKQDDAEKDQDGFEDTYIDDAIFYVEDEGYFDVYGDKVDEKVKNILSVAKQYKLRNKAKNKVLKVFNIAGGKRIEATDAEATATKYDECLQEAIDTDLNKKLAEYNDFIEFIQKEIAEKENSLAKARNSFIKDAIQAEIDDLKAKLEATIPEQVKAEKEVDELPTPEEVDVDADSTGEEEVTEESLNLSKEFKNKKHTSENDSENLTLNEDILTESPLSGKHTLNKQYPLGYTVVVTKDANGNTPDEPKFYKNINQPVDLKIAVANITKGAKGTTPPKELAIFGVTEVNKDNTIKSFDQNVSIATAILVGDSYKLKNNIKSVANDIKNTNKQNKADAKLSDTGKAKTATKSFRHNADFSILGNRPIVLGMYDKHNTYKTIVGDYDDNTEVILPALTDFNSFKTALNNAIEQNLLKDQDHGIGPVYLEFGDIEFSTPYKIGNIKKNKVQLDDNELVDLLNLPEIKNIELSDEEDDEVEAEERGETDVEEKPANGEAQVEAPVEEETPAGEETAAAEEAPAETPTTGTVTETPAEAPAPTKSDKLGNYNKLANNLSKQYKLPSGITIGRNDVRALLGVFKKNGYLESLDTEALVETLFADNQANESLHKSKFIAKHKSIESEQKTLNEDAFDALLDSEEFKKPISDAEVQHILDKADSEDDFDVVESMEDIDECKLQDCLSESIKKRFNNVVELNVTKCEVPEAHKLVVEALVKFNSGINAKAHYTFTEAKLVNGKLVLRGLNESKENISMQCALTESMSKIVPEKLI